MGEKPKKILVVDNERHIVKLIQINLENAGFGVVTAYDGVEALEQVKAEKPDLITLNVMMPRMNGWDVMTMLQDNPETQDIPVIFITGKTSDADIFKGWRLGCASYHTKPFNPVEVIRHIRMIFDRIEEASRELEEELDDYD